MHRGRDPHLTRHLVLLSLAATAPVALGVAMHEEHLAMQRPVVVDACEPSHRPAIVAVPTPIAIATPTIDPVAPAEPPAAEPIPLTYGEAFAFVVNIDGPHVVLSTTIDERWIGGSARVIESGSLRRPVDLEAMPDDIAARLGASFNAYSSEGLVCSGTIGAPFLHAATSDWDVEMYDEEIAQMDHDTFTWEQGRRILVAPLDGAGACDDAVWARAADLPAPTFATPIARPTKVQVQAARRGFLRTAAMRTAATDFDTWIAETGSEPDARLGRTPRLRDRLSSTAWDLGGDGVEAVVLDIDGPEFGGCGGIEGRWGLAVVTEDGANVQRILPGASGRALGLFDVDGDGTSEILAGPRGDWENLELLRLSAEGLEPVAALAPIPFFGCPC
jgi:hypothetical protein